MDNFQLTRSHSLKSLRDSMMIIPIFLFLVAIAGEIQSKVLSHSEPSFASIVTATTNGIGTVCENRDFVINIILPSTFERNIELQYILHEVVDDIVERQVCVYRIKMATNLKLGTVPMRLSVFIIDASDYKEISQNITPVFFNFRTYFIIVLLNGTRSDMQAIFDDMWKKYIYNVNIVHKADSGENAVITTFLPFHNERCSDTTPVELNESSAFFPDKMSNLHKCPIIVATSLDADPCVYPVKMANGSVTPAGSDVNVIKTLSKVLNFQIHYNFTRTQGYLEANGSAEGPFKLLVEKRAHLAFDCYWLTKTRISILDSTAAYYNDYAILVVPPGQDLTPFEKLLYPFSWNVWIALCVCIFFGLLAIFIVRSQVRNIRQNVFGERNQSPAMNLLSILLVGCQHIWPRNLFARLLLLNFLIFTMNMRTLYQGALFELMHSNKKHDEMKSIEEVRDNGLPIYVLKTTSEMFINNQNVNGSLVTVSSQQREKTMKGLEESSFKGSLIMAKYKILTRNFLNKGQHQLTICRDRLMSISIVSYTPRNFYLIDKINEKLSLFNSAGLLQYWHIYDRKVDTLDDGKEPSMLTMHQMQGIFQLVLFGYFASFCVFLGEIVWKVVEKRARVGRK